MHRILIVWVGLLFNFFACSKEPAQRHKIVYNVFHDRQADDYEVFVMNMDGSGQKNISNWKGVDWAYYTFEDKVYFVSDRDTSHRTYFLYEMDAEGNNLRKISDLRMQDSWLSSRFGGTEFIVRPHSSVDSVFYIIDRWGHLIQKVDTGLPYCNDPHFSPDGRKIVFRGAVRKSKREKGYVDELYIINDDGTALRQLTHYPSEDTTAEWYAYRAGPPIWKADGTISFASKRNGNYSIYSIVADGKELKKLTGSILNEVYHDWSRDGTYFIYEGADSANSYEIYMQSSTGIVTQLTSDTLRQFAPLFVRPAVQDKGPR